MNDSTPDSKDNPKELPSKKTVMDYGVFGKDRGH
jgi:hypothetical protein